MSPSGAGLFECASFYDNRGFRTLRGVLRLLLLGVETDVFRKVRPVREVQEFRLGREPLVLFELVDLELGLFKVVRARNLSLSETTDLLSFAQVKQRCVAGYGGGLSVEPSDHVVEHLARIFSAESLDCHILLIGGFLVLGAQHERFAETPPWEVALGGCLFSRLRFR